MTEGPRLRLLRFQESWAECEPIQVVDEPRAHDSAITDSRRAETRLSTAAAEVNWPSPTSSARAAPKLSGRRTAGSQSGSAKPRKRSRRVPTVDLSLYDATHAGGHVDVGHALLANCPLCRDEERLGLMRAQRNSRTEQVQRDERSLTGEDLHDVKPTIDSVN